MSNPSEPQHHHNEHDDPTGENASEQAQAAGRAAGEQAEHIAADAGKASNPEEVRERVRRLVVETLQARELSLEELNEVSRQVLEGAAEGVKEAAPETQRTVLRSVIDGLADSYATAANAARLAFEEANSRRKAFAEEDLRQATRELRALNERFMRTVGRTVERAGGLLREEVGTLRDHANRAAESIRPSMEAALRAAGREPGKFASEAAAAGLDVSRQTAGRLLQAMAGLLQGAGEAIAPRQSETQEQDEEKHG